MKTSLRLGLILILAALTCAPAFAQTPGTKNVMREKLGHSQRILEAILTSKFALLESEIDALAKVTEAPAWRALQGPEYLRQSEAFLKALRELRAAAKDHDLDGAAVLYNELTTSCFACHRYMKDKRLAGQ
jgi:hypothetical protein